MEEFLYYITFGLHKKKGHYTNTEAILYWSDRYKKVIKVPVGYPSDGATGALDVCDKGWFVHDVLCDRGTFDDGTECTNWQASNVLSDILKEEGHFIRTHTWFWATWLLGGGECRKNGMF